MKNYIYKLLTLLLSVVMVSCDLDKQEDPNNLVPEKADFDAVLVSLQVETQNMFDNATDFGMDVTRQHAMFGSQYENAYGETSFNALYTDIYAEVLIDAALLSNEGKANQLFHHAAVADILGAYAMVLAVDYFGDVPYTEALQGDNSILEPVADGGASIYEKALVRLDSALVNLAKEPLRGLPNDPLFYDEATDLVASYTALANTLKIKIALQTRLVDPSGARAIIDGVLNDPDAIIMDGLNGFEDSFSFKYGTEASNPDSRHPWFTENYVTGAGQYMSNYFMDLVLNDKASGDPRMVHYFYRQVSATPTNPQIIPCVNRSAPPHYPFGTAFCTVTSNGYWGRDHLDDDGIPPDNELRTIYGSYPAGGQIDAGQGVVGTDEDGLAGAGIAPIFMSFYTHFMLAEAALTLGAAGGDARTFLQTGMEQSIQFVTSFQGGTAAPTTAYVNEVLAEYDAAGDQEKLEIIAREFYISTFGNGVEAYNLYRRTGAPVDLQPPLLQNAGTFYRTFIYPQALVGRNSNISQKPLDARTFWDPGTITLD